MSVETLLIFLLVGLVAGWLAGVVVGRGGYGLIGDIVVGVVGAFVGGFLVRTLHIHIPIGGIGGHIVVAFLGAVVFLLVLRLVKRRR